MQPKVIKTESEYEVALDIIEKLMDAEPGSPEEEALELWSLLVENYEAKVYPIEKPDPIEAIKFRMDQLGLKANDLSPYMQSKSKVSEVLNRKRALSLSMIRNLNAGLNIPAEVLIREPAASYKASTPAKRRTSTSKTRKTGVRQASTRVAASRKGGTVKSATKPKATLRRK